MGHYEKYVGQFVKRFYRPFEKNAIFMIRGFRINKYGVEEFLYDNGTDEPWWTDCEDSCIITNEMPIQEIAWVANTNSSEYKGYDPFLEIIK